MAEDCTCKHSHYDHVGWRGEKDLKTGCRIIGCECASYAAVKIDFYNLDFYEE